jgi:DNA-binding NarL/FixJ family response regulator
MSLKTLLVDDHAIIVDGLFALLEDHPDINVSATTTSVHFALSYLEQQDFDLLITDYSMPEMSGLELIQRAKVLHPALKVIVLSMHDEPDLVREVMVSGIDAYILKKYACQELYQAIYAIMNNRHYWSVEVTRALVQFKGDIRSNNTVLTEREMDVLKLLAAECTSRQIAEKLFISERTVETHRKNMMRKTNCTTTIGLLKYALSNRLV